MMKPMAHLELVSGGRATEQDFSVDVVIHLRYAYDLI